MGWAGMLRGDRALMTMLSVVSTACASQGQDDSHQPRSSGVLLDAGLDLIPVLGLEADRIFEGVHVDTGENAPPAFQGPALIADVVAARAGVVRPIVVQVSDVTASVTSESPFAVRSTVSAIVTTDVCGGLAAGDSLSFSFFGGQTPEGGIGDEFLPRFEIGGTYLVILSPADATGSTWTLERGSVDILRPNSDGTYRDAFGRSVDGAAVAGGCAP